MPHSGHPLKKKVDLLAALADETPELPDFNADAAEVSGFLGESGAVPYAKADYLPLLPTQLRLLPDASWVRKLVICEPASVDQFTKDASGAVFLITRRLTGSSVVPTCDVRLPGGDL